MKNLIVPVGFRLATFALIAAVSSAVIPTADAGTPANANAFGRTIADYMRIYQKWSFGVMPVPTDSNGNAVLDHHMVLMPTPNTPGDGTPGQQDVTLSPGQPFVLPLFGLFGTDYTDDTPPDQFAPLSVFQTLTITFSVDGKTEVDSSNATKYYSAFFFSPPIAINQPPTDSVIWFQGIGIIHKALSPGEHTMQLDVANTQPAFGSIFTYHNTWSVTVLPKN